MKPLLRVGQKPTPQDAELSCPDSSGLPDVSGTGSLMSARSLGRPRQRDATALQQVLTPAASAACANVGTAGPPVRSRSGAAHANAANVSITQAGAFPVRQGSTGALQPGLMPRRSLTMEYFPLDAKPLASRRSLCGAKQHSVPLEVASTALQLMGAPFGSIGGSAAVQGGQLPKGSGSSVSSGCKQLVGNSLLYSPQLSEGTKTLPATDSDGDGMIPAVTASAPRRSTSIKLGDKWIKWGKTATRLVHDSS